MSHNENLFENADDIKDKKTWEVNRGDAVTNTLEVIWNLDPGMLGDEIIVK